MSFTVRVVDNNGNGWSDRSVMVGFPFSHSHTSTEYTDRDGYVEFDVEDNGGSATCKIYVDGDEYGEYTFDDGEAVTINLEGGEDEED